MIYHIPNTLSTSVVHERCKKARLLNGYRPQDVAKELHIDVETVKQLESKASEVISLDYIVQLSRLCGVSSDYLLGLSDYPENEPQHIELLTAYNSAKHEFKRTMLNELQQALERTRNLVTLAYLSRAIDTITENAERIERLREINPNFDNDIRGGASYIKFLADIDRDIVKKSNVLLRTLLTEGDREKLEDLKKIITDPNTLQDDITTLQEKYDFFEFEKIEVD